jgi:hypothetical protein
VRAVALIRRQPLAAYFTLAFTLWWGGILLVVGPGTVLPVYRILMVWVYEQTGSLLIAMLMHASLTSSLLILGPQAANGVPLLVYQAVFAGALLAFVAAIFVARSLRTPSRAPAGR